MQQNATHRGYKGGGGAHTVSHTKPQLFIRLLTTDVQKEIEKNLKKKGKLWRLNSEVKKKMRFLICRLIVVFISEFKLQVAGFWSHFEPRVQVGTFFQSSMTFRF